MFAWQATVQDEFGNAVLLPVVTVYLEDGLTLANIYDESGDPLPNPLTGTLEGFVQFWAEVGRFKIDSGGDNVWTWINESTPPIVQEYDSLSDAVADNVGGGVRINYDAASIPSDYRDVVLDYTVKSSNRTYQQTSFSGNKSHRTLRTASGSHAGRTESAMHTEMLAWGSTANGPLNATLGNSIYITKRGYAGGSAVGGEIDALEIFLRQDGPDGLPSFDPGSSDASALIINAQNAGTCGFIAVLDATSSNILRSVGFPIDLSMQVQAGVIDANNADGKIGYGFAAVAKVGTLRTAFHAGVNGGVWENLFDSPKIKVDWSGSVIFKDAAHASYAGRVRRTAGENGSLRIENNGVGGISLSNGGAANINFEISGSVVMQITTGSALAPFVDNTCLIGTPSKRFGEIHSNSLSVYGGILNASGIPTYATNAAAVSGGLAVGRVYKTATGELRIVV